MGKPQGDLYYKGYIVGYRDGRRDAEEGRTIKIDDNDIANLPIEAMAVSARAYNCLSQVGCKYITDVALLDDHTIATMRNLGLKTALEIARWLDAHGICYSAWSKYL